MSQQGKQNQTNLSFRNYRITGWEPNSLRPKVQNYLPPNNQRLKSTLSFKRNGKNFKKNIQYLNLPQKKDSSSRTINSMDCHNNKLNQQLYFSNFQNLKMEMSSLQRSYDKLNLQSVSCDKQKKYSYLFKQKQYDKITPLKAISIPVNHNNRLDTAKYNSIDMYKTIQSQISFIKSCKRQKAATIVQNRIEEGRRKNVWIRKSKTGEGQRIKQNKFKIMINQLQDKKMRDILRILQRSRVT